ncbi:MAG: hypothetical protein KKH49_05540, partial [Candidatus Omnitrophica bacterium]|nr:hypothetical protein [Candidatus Omnitrophota bacterium]
MKNKLLSFVLVLSLIGLVGVLSTSYAANQAGVSPTLTEPKLARPSGGSEDSDNDSYSDLCEYLHKTNPNDSESKPSSNITINVPSDVKTIQGAINASVDGDTIAVSQGKYQGNINFNDKSITLTSTDPLNSDVVANTIIEGTESGSVVTIDSVSVLKGLTITSKGLDCRGIYIKDASPTIENCTIIDNQTTSYGGGIYMSTSSRPKIINCIISGNKDSSTGKSAQVYGGTPQISQSWINGQGLVDNTIEEPTTLIPETSTAEIIPTKTTPHIAPDAATPVIQNANKVGRTKWIKEGNIAHTYFENVKAIQEANISCSLAVSFQPPQFETKDSYNRIQISGLDIWNGTAGAPILPFKPMRILIPYGQKAVGVRVIPGSSQEISGEYILEPAQKPVPLSQLEYAQFTPPNPEIYNSDNPYPYVPCGDAFLQKKSGYTILILNLFPVEYHPLSRKILYYPNMSVEVETVPLSKVYTEEAGVSLSPDLQVQNEIKALVDNPDVLQTYETGTEVDRLRAEGEQYEYVIITNNALASAPGPYNFQALRDSKMARVNAMTATIVTTEYIYDNYDGTRPHGGTDNQTKIRNFIIDYYQNHGTRYVLLAGDSNIIPPRYLSVWYTFQPYPYFVSIPADLYYGCLDGTFDYDCDGTYGEHTDGPEGWEVDLYAEVYIGRAPVATAAEVSNFVRKTLTYENATGDYLHSVYMLGEHLGFGGVSEWATDALEEIRLGSYAYSYATVGFENSIYANYFETHTLYDSPSYSWTTSELIGVINAGVHIFNHFGHGDYGTCMCVNKPFCTDNLASLTNTDYFFVYSQACTPGSFDSSNCFAEVITTMDEGAFAVVMNARLGWGRYDSTDGPSQRYNRQFWDALLGENITNLGRMNQDSKEDNACKINEDYNCMQWCYYELNLFGDPEISINVNTENGPQIWYVDDSVSISGDGKTWNTAFKYLEDALNNPLLTPSDEIWVAQGTYKPDNTPPYDRTATFLLKNGVTIKGGYAGYGASNPYAHDIEAYSTILSGDLNSNDGPDFTNYDDNSYHVTSVFGSSIGPSYSQPTLDGFTIKGGNANGDWWDDAGGGMRNEFSAA